MRRLRAFAREPIGSDGLGALIERALRFNPRRRPEQLRRSLLHNLRPSPDGRWAWKYDPQLGAGGFGDLGERLREARRGVAKIACPALVVHGAESDIVSAAESRRLAGLLSNGRWAQVPGAGHTVQGDDPKGPGGAAGSLPRRVLRRRRRDASCEAGAVFPSLRRRVALCPNRRQSCGRTRADHAAWILLDQGCPP